ncbi:MAG: hypothetical protein Q4E73_01590 [Lachnospiraceae bacterium]|nr:hypothetical protein [Lachnospiraceae bacterium]
MGTIMIDFVIDATESASGNLPAVNLFCDDLIVKGYRKLSPFHDVRYGITAFYGKEDAIKSYRFKENLFTGDRYRFNRTFDTIEICAGSADGKDHILGGMMHSSRKLKEADGDLKVMLVFSDSYMERVNFEKIGVLSAQSVYLYLSDQEELGEVRMNLFWGIPMVNKKHKVDHRLMPHRCSLADIFDSKGRETQIDRIMKDILELVEQ